MKAHTYYHVGLCRTVNNSILAVGLQMEKLSIDRGALPCCSYSAMQASFIYKRGEPFASHRHLFAGYACKRFGSFASIPSGQHLRPDKLHSAEAAKGAAIVHNYSPCALQGGSPP